MTAPHDLDRQLNAFLLDGPTELPDPSFDAVRDHIESTRQRVFIGPWRFPVMNKFLAIGLGTGAVVLALVVGTRLLGSPTTGGVGGAPSTAPSAAPSVVPTATPRPSLATPAPTPVAFVPVGKFAWVPKEGDQTAMTVTIPAAGWMYWADFNSLNKGEDGDPQEAGMLRVIYPVGAEFRVYGDPCKWQSTIPKTSQKTAAEIVAALAAQPGRDASVTDVTIGGFTGKKITLHVSETGANRAEAFKDCDQQTYASWGDGDGLTPARYHQGPGQIDEMWFLDVNGQVVVIDAMYRQAGEYSPTPAGWIDEMRSIAESATFK